MHGLKRCHYLVIVSVFLIMVPLIIGMAGCGGEGGGGGDNAAPSENLEIRTWYDLNATRDNLGGNHILINDLNSTTPGYEELASPAANGGKGWQPIGTWECPAAEYDTGFTGTFDGQRHEICDLVINRPDQSYVGLFGFARDGVIKDIGVVNVTVSGNDSVGGLLGCNAGTVSGSYFTGNVTGGDVVGGLVGRNCGRVSNSCSSGNVTGNTNVGGLVGHTDMLGAVSNSYSTSSVTGDLNVGGLLGWNAGTLSKSYSTGTVTGSAWTGGLVGDYAYGSEERSFWDIETSGQATSGGGTGKNTAEMQHTVTFSAAGWNIITVALNESNPAYVWNIVNNVTYPFLSWQH